MKIALIGHGKTGQEVEIAAREKGHEITQIFDLNTPFSSEKVLGEVEVFIDFSAATATLSNIEIACSIGRPLVIGTTGWLGEVDKARSIVNALNGAVVYAANFSIGAALFFKISEHATAVFKNFPQYGAALHEVHHIHKKDAPSGTALELKARLKNYPEIKISSERVGDVPGTHTLTFESDVDAIEITHRAKNRRGFADGAVLAAEWIVGKKGFFTIDDVINDYEN